MDSDTSWFRIDTPCIPFYIEPLYHFAIFLLYAVVITILALLVLHSVIFIIFDHVLKWEFVFFGFSFTQVAWILFNSATIYTITLTSFRGLMSTWLFIFVACVYAAVIKWQFGTLFLGLDTINYWSVLIIGVYVSTIAELAALYRGTISTALTYRI